MPTEFEYKYAISMNLLRSQTEKDVAKVADNHIIISQGYLAFSKGMSCRIRCATEYGKDKWFLTFKQKVTDRVIEIEKKLDNRDGTQLWEIAVGKLKKDRYVIKHDGICWEFDFFKANDQTYFLLAEVELSEGAPRPKTIPPMLEEYLLFEVPLTDDRFSNKRLGDVNYAKQLYKEISGDKDVSNSKNKKDKKDKKE